VAHVVTYRVLGCLLALVVAACQAEQPTPSSTSLAADDVVAAATPSAAAPTPTASAPSLGTGDVTARYDDGLPQVIGGQPVLRGQAAMAYATTRTDDAPFLVTGWVDYIGGTRYCAAGPQPDESSWRRDCVGATMAHPAGSFSPELIDAITNHYVLEDLHSGPVVAVVRVHDSRASDCGTKVRAICDAMMVVQRVTWSGDSATAAGPLTPTGVRDALVRIGVPGEMGASCSVPPWIGCGIDALTSADAYPVVVGDDTAPAITAISIEPSVAALQRALPRADGVDAALKKGAIVMHAGSKNGFGAPWVYVDYRWLVVGNVALLIRTHSPATNKDRTFMERLVAALATTP
jgi:hypothetical protein